MKVRIRACDGVVSGYYINPANWRLYKDRYGDDIEPASDADRSLAEAYSS